MKAYPKRLKKRFGHLRGFQLSDEAQQAGLPEKGKAKGKRKTDQRLEFTKAVTNGYRSERLKCVRLQLGLQRQRRKCRRSEGRGKKKDPRIPLPALEKKEWAVQVSCIRKHDCEKSWSGCGNHGKKNRGNRDGEHGLQNSFEVVSGSPGETTAEVLDLWGRKPKKKSRFVGLIMNRRCGQESHLLTGL